jgi:hypothetical protein
MINDFLFILDDCGPTMGKRVLFLIFLLFLLGWRFQYMGKAMGFGFWAAIGIWE